MKSRVLTQPDAVSKKIAVDRLRLLNQHLFTSIPAAIICASIIYISVYRIISFPLAFGWYLAISIVYILRVGLQIFYHYQPQHFKLHQYLFLVGLALSAALWGVAGSLLMPVDHYQEQTIIIVIIAGITAGALQTLQSSLFASIMFIVLAIGPMMIWLFLRQSTLYFYLSFAIFTYGFFMLTAMKRGYELINATLRLHYENRQINTQLEETNKLLIKEVIKQQQNAKSLAQLAAIVEFSEDAIIGLDIYGVIQTWNKGAESLYGYNEQEMIGQSIEKITPKGQYPIIVTMLKNVASNHSEQLELERQHKKGYLIPVSVTISPIKNEHHQIIGISSVDRDISEQKEMARVKDEFISIVSHELRTPLTSIKGSLSLLLSDAKTHLNTKYQHLIQIAHNNCERLIRLINDILDVEKIESGKLVLNMKEINIKDLILLAIEENKAYADKYQVAIEFHHPQDAWVNGDFDRLMQVMTNLLSNAVKFSYPQRAVQVSMTLRDQTVRIDVTDEGPGIPFAYQQKIFEKFTQADSSATRAKGGTGLGLSITKAIIEAHHSQIYFVTEEGRGTTFYFSLPLLRKTHD